MFDLTLGPAPVGLTVRLVRGFGWRCGLRVARPDGSPPGSGPGGSWQWLPDLGALPRLVFTTHPAGAASTFTTWQSTEAADPAEAVFTRTAADVTALLALLEAVPPARVVSTLAVGDTPLAVGGYGTTTAVAVVEAL